MIAIMIGGDSFSMTRQAEDMSMGKKRTAIMVACMLACGGCLARPAKVRAREESMALLVQQYEAYREAFEAIGSLADVEEAGYDIIEEQRFPVQLETFGEEQVELVRTAYEYQFLLNSFTNDITRLKNAAKAF